MVLVTNPLELGPLMFNFKVAISLRAVRGVSHRKNVLPQTFPIKTILGSK